MTQRGIRIFKKLASAVYPGKIMNLPRVLSMRLGRVADKVVFAVLVLVVALLPIFRLNDYVLHVVIVACIYGVLASSWDLVVGYAGQLTFGHAGFFGLGAYTSALLSIHLGISPWLGMGFAAVSCGISGFIVGLLSLRLRGPYLALTTLAFAETVRTVALDSQSLTGGPGGLIGYPPFPGVPYTNVHYLYLALGLLVISTLGLYLLVRSSFGARLRAIREDEVLAQTHGLNVSAYKLAAFVISSSLAGIAGAFYAHYILLLTPDQMAPLVTAIIVAMAAVGGLGTIVGPVIGAFVIQFISEFLRGYGVTYHLILVGLVVVAVTLYFPGGMFGVKRRGGRLVPVGNHE